MEPIKYIEIAIAVMIFTAIILFIAWQIKKNGLKKFIVDFIVYAEANIKDNHDKFDYVVGRVVSLIPMPFSLFITDTMVEKLVQTTFDTIKKALDYQKGE